MVRNVISQLDRSRIVILIEQGSSQREVAAHLGINQSDVSRTWNRFIATNSTKDRPRSGRPRVGNANSDRFMSLVARRNRFSSIGNIQGEVRRGTGVALSLTTIRRRLAGFGLRRRRPTRVPKLTLRHRQTRLEWCRTFQGRGMDFWRHVMFSDETRVCLTSDNRRSRVWREPGDQNRLRYAVETVPYRGGSVMFWAGIMIGERTPLVPIPGTLNGQNYIEHILRRHVRLWRGAVGEHFVFMDDNAPPHRTNAVRNFLEEEGIDRMEWPPMSPDLNPIEHAWDVLKRAIARRPQPPLTRQELIRVAIEEWQNLPFQTIDELIMSMERRIQACINARGGNTLY